MRKFSFTLIAILMSIIGFTSCSQEDEQYLTASEAKASNKVYVDGHAWVVDGYIDQIKNSKESKYVHCNWGWGGDSNGYFLSDVLNAEQNPVFNDNAETTRASSNFRYNLKAATFTK